MICHSPLLWLNIGDAYASLFRIPHCVGWLEIEIAKKQRLDISGGLICLPVRKAPDLSQLRSCSIWKSTLSQNRSSWQKRPQNLLTYPPQTQQNQKDANRQPLWHQGTPSQSSPAWRRCRSWSLCSPFDSHDLNLKLPPDPARSSQIPDEEQRSLRPSNNLRHRLQRCHKKPQFNSFDSEKHRRFYTRCNEGTGFSRAMRPEMSRAISKGYGPYGDIYGYLWISDIHIFAQWWAPNIQINDQWTSPGGRSKVV